MKLSEFNEYLQTTAALGAIVALIALGYEIRQSNRIAISEASAAIWTNWTAISLTHMESGFAQTRSKSMTNPDDLTLPEKIDLDFYLQSWMYATMLDIESMHILGNEGLVPFLNEEAAEEAPRIFGSRFARAWLQENKSWIYPDLLTAIESRLEITPIGSDLEYFERIDALAANLE